MNEEERGSQVSALFDGELPPAEHELVVRRLLKDPALAARWSRYAAIGAVLRDEPLAVRVGTGDLAARLRARLEAEPALPEGTGTVVAPGRRAAGLFARGAAGAAIAAGVAALAVILLRAQAPGAPEALVAATTAEPAAVAVRPVAADTVPGAMPAPPPSYTTPVDVSPAGEGVGASLVSYVVAHSEYATPAVRYSPLSSVMSGTLDPAAGTVETTEAEVRGLR